jgi:hypothetical protein
VRVFALHGGGPPRDWVGFDGPVQTVAWSHQGRWLAAAGGTVLMAAPAGLRRGVAPTLCVAPGGARPRVAAVAWCPDPRRETLLAAVEAGAGVAHVFDVRHADQAVPRRATPLLTVAPPFSTPEASVAPRQLLFGGDVGGLLLLLSSVGCLAAFQIPAVDDSDDDAQSEIGSAEPQIESDSGSSGGSDAYMNELD